MDYAAYDRLQAQLGGVRDGYLFACNAQIQNSLVDNQTKALLSALCIETGNSLQELAGYISDALTAASK